MEFFASEKVSPTVTRIAGLGFELMYLIEGAGSALLVDAGVGAGNLRDYVAHLTDKPVRLLLTHGHLDHIGAAPLFGTACLHPADWPMAKAGNSADDRLGYTLSQGVKGITLADFVPDGPVDFLPLQDGDDFDLGGGVHAQALCLPGHTPGSVAVWLPHERSLLLGDACNTFTFLFDETTLPVAAYREQLLHFAQKHRDKYDRVYLSHGPGDVGADIVEGVVGVCDDILAGNTDDVPFAFMGGSYTVAKAFDPATMARKDGGLGNIVYNKARLR